MKRYVCTVAAGVLLALAGTATASANGGLPEVGQAATQVTELGTQTVGEQENESSVTQEQGNGNVNVAPAIAIGGDASTTNYQGNGNSASATTNQSNEATQSQSSTQKQSVESEGCCNGQSQAGEQRTSGGDQSVEKQKNDATVTQSQGNRNVNIAPAIAISGTKDSCSSKCGSSYGGHGGDASTTNKQGNGNEATANVGQSNEAEQSQSSYQRQTVSGEAGHGACCDGSSQTGEQHFYGGDQTVEKQKNSASVTQDQGNGNVSYAPAYAHGGDASTRNYQGNHNEAEANVKQSNEAEQSQTSTQKQELKQEGGSCCTPSSGYKNGYGKKKSPKGCCRSSSGQSGKQEASFGDQTVGEQRNDATVSQGQGNDNRSEAPAVTYPKEAACSSTCQSSWRPYGGDASTTNKQGNDNTATANVDQQNEVEQSQTSYQRQSLVQTCMGLIDR